MKHVCAFCTNCEESICLAHSKGYEAFVRHPFAQGYDCRDFDYDAEREAAWEQEQAERLEQRRLEREAAEKAAAEAKAKADAEAAAKKAAFEAELARERHEWSLEYNECKRRIAESLLGHGDLKPNGHFLKIRKYCFQLTEDLFAVVRATLTA